MNFVGAQDVVRRTLWRGKWGLLKVFLSIRVRFVVLSGHTLIYACIYALHVSVYQLCLKKKLELGLLLMKLRLCVCVCV